MGYDIPADHHGSLPKNKEEGKNKMRNENEGIFDTLTTIVSINILVRECYQNAKDHGFWDDEDKLINYLEHSKYRDNSEFEELKKRVISLFNSEKIALEMSELAERLECLRKNPYKTDEHCPDFLNLEIEVADLIIRALDFSGRRKLRIGEALIAKMKYNKSRPFMHGKKF